MTTIADLKAKIDVIDGPTLVFASGEDLNPALPYVTILDPVSDAVLLQGDSRTLARRRLAQVDVWQDEASFSEALVDDVVDAIDGASAAGGFHYRVVDVQNIPEPDDVVHHALTVSLTRLRSPV